MGRTFMKKLILSAFIIASCCGAKGQSRIDSVSQRLELWIDKVDHMYESNSRMRDFIFKLSDKVDSLTQELKNQKELLKFNTTMSNYYINRVDSFISVMRQRDYINSHLMDAIGTPNPFSWPQDFAEPKKSKP
jgi:hypothetical protein